MNKLTKVGFSALCSSLAAISAAQAGDLTVTGGADMTWVNQNGMSTTGNPIGMGSNLTFKGSGELDNGWTFDTAVAHKNSNAFSAAYLNLTMGGLGTFSVNQGDSGNGIAVYDDKMPTAWEEPWGGGLSTGVKTVGGVGASMHWAYETPKILGTTLEVAYAPVMGQSDTADKGTGGPGTSKGHGYDATININPSMGTEILSGLNIYAGAHYTDQHTGSAAVDTNSYEAVAGVTMDIGPVSLGYAQSGHIMGEETATGSVNHYRGNMYGVAFNINDDLSVSYGKHESRKAGYNNASRDSVSEANRRIEVASWQVSYTLGGASMRLAEIKGDKLDFSSAKDKDATVFSLGLAF
jgi:outer membrane protein OmpU